MGPSRGATIPRSSSAEVVASTQISVKRLRRAGESSRLPKSPLRAEVGVYVAPICAGLRGASNHAGTARSAQNFLEVEILIHRFRLRQRLENGIHPSFARSQIRRAPAGPLTLGPWGAAPWVHGGHQQPSRRCAHGLHRCAAALRQAQAAPGLEHAVQALQHRVFSERDLVHKQQRAGAHCLRWCGAEQGSDEGTAGDEDNPRADGARRLGQFASWFVVSAAGLPPRRFLFRSRVVVTAPARSLPAPGQREPLLLGAAGRAPSAEGRPPRRRAPPPRAARRGQGGSRPGSRPSRCARGS